MRPTIELLRRLLAERGLTLEGVAREMSPHNPGKSLHKLRRGSEEGDFTPMLIETLRRRLGVARDEWTRAEAEDHRIRQREMVAWQRHNFSPHIWVETIPGWSASPLFAAYI